MYKLLLHIGLPKTATTSLQCNVLMPLHEQGRINFLGSSEVPGGLPFFDPFRDVFKRIKAKPLSPDELRRLRPVAEAMLDRRRLNVISKESITSETVYDDGTRRDSLAMLHNLAELFRGDDVTVLISLRSPMDRVLSAYVKGYRWRSTGEGGTYNTIDQFVSELLRHGPDDESWFTFFYNAYLRALARHFDRIKVLLYEDLQHDRPSYFSQLGALLQSDPQDIQRLFLVARRNASVYTRLGKLSPRLTVRQIIREYCPSVSRCYAHCRSMLERIPLLIPLCRRLADIETDVRIEDP